MSLVTTLLNVLSGPLVKAVTDVIKDNNKTTVDKNKLEADVKKAIFETVEKLSSEQSKVIVAEANSQDKLVRRWRPMVALSMIAVLLFYSVFVPIAVDWFGAPPLRVGDLLLNWIYTLALTCVGGYMGLRTVEKLGLEAMRRWR